MAGIPDEVVAEVRARVELVKVVGERLKLRRVGSHWQGLCPFHGEKSPSFDVRPDRNTFKCFGCGEQGDAIAFIMKLDGLAFPDAVRALAYEAGITVPDEDSTAPRPYVKRPSALERRLSRPPEAPSYPPVDEVNALWAGAAPVLDVAPVATWLREGRRIDPQVVTDLDLARVVMAEPGDVPAWAAYAVGQGYRLAVPLYDSRGVMRSFKFRPTGARYAALCERSEREGEPKPPKARAPSRIGDQRVTVHLLVNANGLAVDILRRGSKAGAEYRAAMCCESIHTLVTEGELDYLTAAALEDAPVIFGVASGAWSASHASAVPAGRVTIATDGGDSGDKYAAEIRASLSHRSDVHVTRWRAHQAGQDFNDAGGFAGGEEHGD
mgnify:FL=1